MVNKKTNPPKSRTKGSFKEAAGGAAAYAAFNSVSDILKNVLTDASKDVGEKIIEGIKVRTLGLGPNDEALYNEVKTLLSGGVIAVKKLDLFIEEMKMKGFSFWWFRNVIATMHQNVKLQPGETKKDSPAVKIIEAIISQDKWEDQAQVAGPSLLVKSFRSRAGGIWDIIKVRGKKVVIFPKDKISEIDWHHVATVISKAAEDGVDDFARGFKNPFHGHKTTGVWISLIVGAGFIALVIAAAISI